MRAWDSMPAYWANSPLRFGLGAQLLVPNGLRSDHDTDGYVRGMLRALFAGDTGILTTAAQLGVHIRPLTRPAPAAPAAANCSTALRRAPDSPSLPIGA